MVTEKECFKPATCFFTFTTDATNYSSDGPVHHALGVHLSRAKSITCFDDRYTEAKFGTKFQREVPLFLECIEFPVNAVQDGWKKAPVPKTSPIRSAVSIEHRPVTDRHRVIAIVPALAIQGAVKFVIAELR